MAASFVGKEEHLDKSPFDLSGGENEGCNCRCYGNGAKALTLDEPTSGLDLRRDTILGMIKSIGRTPAARSLSYRIAWKM